MEEVEIEMIARCIGTMIVICGGGLFTLWSLMTAINHFLVG